MADFDIFCLFFVLIDNLITRTGNYGYRTYGNNYVPNSLVSRRNKLQTHEDLQWIWILLRVFWARGCIDRYVTWRLILIFKFSDSRDADEISTFTIKCYCICHVRRPVSKRRMWLARFPCNSPHFDNKLRDGPLVSKCWVSSWICFCSSENNK